MKRNWLAVSIIWIGALVLTFLNAQTVQQIKTDQAAIESLRMDSTFLNNNFEKITQVLSQRSALHKRIDSLPIELVSLESMLNDRMQKGGLSDFRMQTEPSSRRADQISLKLGASGSYRQMALWLRALERDVPHLVVTGIQMLKDPETEGFDFSLHLDFRFKLASGEGDAR